MYAGFLYRLNYEDYKKREQELDEKIKQLSRENVDKSYIIRIGGEKISASGYFLLLVGDDHYDAEYIEDVLFGQEETYARHKELQKKDIKAMTWEEMQEGCSLWEKFAPDAEGDLSEIAKMIVEGKSGIGEIVKQIF